MSNMVTRSSFAAVAVSAFALAAAALSGAGAQTEPRQPGPPAAQDPNSRKAEPRGKAPQADPKSSEAPKAGDPATPDAAGKSGPKRSALAPPRTPAEREKLLSDLYAHLATADSEASGKTIADTIEQIWLYSGSDTVSLLMERALTSYNAKKPELALKLLDSVLDLAPDYAEGWNRRAFIHFKQNNVERALGDLRRALALDPNHFKALDGLGNILREIGQKKAALAAFEQLESVHPNWPGVKTVIEELRREVEGQGI